MLRQIKPRNARSKRALDKKAPKAVENPKTCLFLRGTSCSRIAQDALTDLYALRRPLAKKFSKKNDIHPFADATSLEFLGRKNDAALLVFGATSKKRPHALTLARTFDGRLLDMLELLLEADAYRGLAHFRGAKCAVGLRPLLLFSGTPFESPVATEYTLAKSLLTDFFRGLAGERVDVEGLQYMVHVAARDEVAGEEARPKIHLRVYRIKTKKSGGPGRLPRVEVEEMGPRMDFRVGRMREPEAAAMKEALRTARGGVERPKKNVVTDIVGDKIGRIHLGKQDLKSLQTRKMKGLKRARGDDLEGMEDDEDPGEVEGGKRRRKH